MPRVRPAQPTPQELIDAHEWISFDDGEEQRTWVFDATFLRSGWTCIFGAGCKGVLDVDATDLVQGCCSHGAHFVDDDDVQTVVSAVVRLRTDQWQHHRKGMRSGFLAPIPPDEGEGSMTRVVDGACIFHNRPGFPGGVGCALHIAALEAGERPLDWKPDVCWQLPLRLDHHTDDNGHVTSTLREWKRRDWGAGGDDFHWWCTESADAFVSAEPVYVYLREEIVELVGQRAYDQLLGVIERRGWTPLPHPALKRR